MIDIFKNVAAVVGCISACIALLTTIVKPLRQRIVDTISHKSQWEEVLRSMNDLHGKVDNLTKDNTDVKNRLKRVEKNVLDNEADRIRTELFDCGNRCRRGIRLHPEEFDHLRDVFKKYSEVLHQNSSGEVEFNFICDYYNHQDFPTYHQPNKDVK